MSAWRLIPVEAASEMMAMSLEPRMKASFCAMFTSLRATCGGTTPGF